MNKDIWLKMTSSGMIAVCAATVLSSPITPDQACVAAHTWASARPQAHMGATLGVIPESVYTETNEIGKAIFHVVRLSGGGFVVTSADDTIQPIIAFSESKDFVRDGRNPLWAMLKRDMSKCRRKSPLVLCASVAAEDSAKREWEDLLGDTGCPLLNCGKVSLSDVRVPALLTTEWGQEQVNGENFYNYKTPNNYPCGCVATAGAQLMRYHRYPTSAIVKAATNVQFKCRIDGVATYKKIAGVGLADESKYFPDDTVSAMTDTSGKYSALDKFLVKFNMSMLFSDIGIISRMNWSKNGSSAFLFVLADAMSEYYGYASAKYYMCLDGSSPMAFLENAIYANLDAHCPVLLGINNDDGNIGHAIVADGYGCYNNNIYTHLNLGWDGDCNAWYSLPSIDAGDCDFTLVNVIAYNIFPQKTGEIIAGRVTLNSGSAQGGVSISAVCGAETVQTTTDSRGIYSLVVDGGKTWNVSASMTGYIADEQKIVVGNSISTSYALNSSGNLISVADDEVGSVGNVWGVNFELRIPGSTYTVTYDPGVYGTGSQQTATKTDGTALVLKGAIFTRTGYTQTGWATADGGTREYALDGTYTANAAITLYPVWTANTYTITYNPGSNGSGVQQTESKTHGVPLMLKGAVYSRTGYEQTGWTTIDGWPLVYSLNAIYIINAAITLYPVWSPNTYTITYNPGSLGEGAQQAVTKSHGDDLTLEGEIFSRAGYTQTGWAIEDGGVKVYELNASYTTDEDVSLYPFWTIIPEGPVWIPITKCDNVIGYYVVTNVSTHTAVESTGSKLGVFAANGECRGVADITNGPKGRLFQIAIGIEDSSEKGFVFKVWDAASEMVLNINETLTATVGMDTVGTIAAPIVLTSTPSVAEADPFPAAVAKSMNVTLYAQVYDKSADAYLDADGSILAAFDANGECRGKVSVMAGPNDSRLYQLTIGYESASEQGITLKLWDSETGEILDIPQSEVLYVSSQIVGSLSTPIVYQFGVVTQDITLNEGWNWISTYLTVEENDVGTFFGDFEFADDDIVKCDLNSATYYDCTWYPDDFMIEPCRAYVVKKGAGGSETHTIEGSASTDAITVNPNWNWFGSCCEEVKTVADLQHSGGFTDDDIIKGALESATYKNGNWYPSTLQLKPGVGYLAKLSNGGELTFAASALSANSVANETVSEKKLSLNTSSGEIVAPSWSATVKPGTFTLYARVKDSGGNYIETDGSLLAAFDANGECRGVHAIGAGPTVKMYQLSIGIDEDDDDPQFTLKIWNAADGIVSEIETKVKGAVNDILGTISEPLEYVTSEEDPTPSVPVADFGLTFNTMSLAVDVGTQPSSWTVGSVLPTAADYVESANGAALNLGSCSAKPYVSVPSMIGSGKSFAISYFGTISNITKGVFWSLRSTLDVQGLAFQQGNAGVLQLRWRKGTSSAESAIVLTNGFETTELTKPHHYVVQVATTGLVSFYIDGTKVSSTTPSRNFTASAYDGFGLGCFYGGVDHSSFKHGNGIVDDFRVFTSTSETCLSDEEVATLSASFSRGGVYPTLPDDATPERVHDALDGSTDTRLAECITNVAVYNAYLDWAATVTNSSGAAVGAGGVKGAAHAWFSFAVGSPVLITEPPTADDIKVDAFTPSSESGKFDFEVSVDGVTVGSEALKENLKQVFGLEGSKTLNADDFSASKVDITFGTPENGKVKFTAGPNSANADSDTFFMKVKVTP